MGVSLLLMALTGVFWFLGMRNADEVIGILEKLMAAVLLVLTLSFLVASGALVVITAGAVAWVYNNAAAQRPKSRHDTNDVSFFHQIKEGNSVLIA